MEGELKENVTSEKEQGGKTEGQAADFSFALLPIGPAQSPFAKDAKKGLECVLKQLFEARFDELRAKKDTEEFSKTVNEAAESAAKAFVLAQKQKIDEYIATHQKEHDDAIASAAFANAGDKEEAYRLALTNAEYLVYSQKGNDALVVRLASSITLNLPKEEEPEEAKAPVTEEKPVEEAPAVAEAPKEEPIEEAASAEEAAPAEEPAEEELSEEEEEAEGNGFDRINGRSRPFAEKLAAADKDLQDKYEEIRQEALAYGLHERISRSGNTFRLSRTAYLKITLVGKTLKCYYKLDPKAYDDTSIPHEDASDKKAYEEIPMLFRVRSDLSVRRAEGLIADMMKAAGIEKKPEAKPEVKAEEASKAVEEAPKAEEATAKEAAPAEEAAPVQAAAAPAAQEAPAEAKAVGKYEVYPEAGEFKYRLKANNGEILIVSSGYSTRDGAKAGIETLKKNIEVGTYTVITEKNGFSQFRLFTPNGGRLIAAGEFYKNAAQAESAYQSVKRFSETAKIVDLDEIPADEIREWTVEGLSKDGDKDGGKLQLFTADDKWLVRLVASNGEVLFVSGAYSSKFGALQGLETIKAKLHEANPFHIIVDKQKRYQFVVESGNGATLLLGETYPSRDSAVSAAKSALSFLDHAVLEDTTTEEKKEEEAATTEGDAQ